MRTESPPNIEEYDYCVIGAGVAGLNALAVARCYLPASARVLLVDRRPREGGMWTDTYDYVRLHQPHRMFTAGDIPWSTHRAREYLADKSEVLLCDETIKSISASKRKSPGQILIRWALQRNTLPLCKTQTETRMIENRDVFDFYLTSAEMEAINALNRNRRYNDPGAFCEPGMGTFCPIYN